MKNKFYKAEYGNYKISYEHGISNQSHIQGWKWVIKHDRNYKIDGKISENKSNGKWFRVESIRDSIFQQKEEEISKNQQARRSNGIKRQGMAKNMIWQAGFIHSEY